MASFFAVLGMVMRDYSLTHLPDLDLLSGLSRLVSSERDTTAAMLAHLAEVEARKLHVKAAFGSMSTYCVATLGMSEGAASKRVTAENVARRCSP